MADKKRNRFFWPDVDSIESATKAKMYGVWAAVFSAVVTALFAAWSLGSGKVAAGYVDAWAFIDAIIFAAIAFGIYKGSRFAAVAGLIFFIIEKIHQILQTGQFQSAFIAIFLVICYVSAARGTYALRRLQSVTDG